MNLIEELRWRGMVQDIMPGTEEQLLKEMTTAYIGFDPTADSLHIGSLVPILLLVHLQKAGHKPVALVGGATGMVGDPSGKSEERNLLSEDVLQKNVAGVKKQLEQFLDFDTSKANAAEMANNYDWFKDFSFLSFIRDVGKHIPVNYMMAKDSVKKRLEGETGMSFTEFTYQLVQGYDFYYLYVNKNCKLQMGGSDQWGNIVTGTELIRSKFSAPHFYLTMSIDMDSAVTSRVKLNEVSKVKISFNDIVLKAVAVSLKQHPKVNSSWLGDKIRYNHHVNIGVAVAVEEGLLVPVVRFADTKSLSQIAAEVKDFAQRAKDKKLQPADWEGSTFTISNLGMFGIDEFTAIINPPDACILAIGGISQVPVVKNGQVVPGNIMKVTLSCDHRVVDGATGAAFLQTLKSFLEEPLRMLV